MAELVDVEYVESPDMMDTLRRMVGGYFHA